MQAFDRKPRTSRTRPLGLAGAAIAIGATGATAEAGTILSPTGVVANSMAGTDTSKIIDQSGLSGGFISGTTDYTTYLTTSPTHTTLFNSSGLSTRDFSWSSGNFILTGNIVFDLGDLYSIERLAIWQGEFSFGKASNSNVNGITLETASDLAFTSPIAAGSFNVPKDANVSAWPVNDFDLTNSVGRYVRLTIDSNHGAALATNFGELAFDVSAATAVPEPGSGLLLLFTAGVVLMFRRLWRHV